jgi:hypothetical protein
LGVKKGFLRKNGGALVLPFDHILEFQNGKIEFYGCLGICRLKIVFLCPAFNRCKDVELLMGVEFAILFVLDKPYSFLRIWGITTKATNNPVAIAIMMG